MPLADNAIVSRLILTSAGFQTAHISTTSAHLDCASLQLTLPELIIQFTTCQQVQELRGYLAFAEPSTMGMIPRRPIMIENYTAQLRNTITITGNLDGAITRDQFTDGTPFVILTWGPVTWRIVDMTAYDSLADALERAHKTARGVFSDGERYKADPTTPSWLSNGGNTLNKRVTRWNDNSRH